MVTRGHDEKNGEKKERRGGKMCRRRCRRLTLGDNRPLPSRPPSSPELIGIFEFFSEHGVYEFLVEGMVLIRMSV